MKALALLLATLGTLPLHAAIISSAIRLDQPDDRIWLTHNFGGVWPIWNDYTFLFKTIQSDLVGADVVSMRYDTFNAANFQLRLTLDVPATLYLGIDNRAVTDVATQMPWVAALGFVDSGKAASVTVLPDTQISFYTANFPAGDVILLGQNTPGDPGMYFVGAVPEPASLAFVLFGTLACLSYRRTHPVVRRASFLQG